ncbi:MAG: hypothetical protein Q8R17_02300 [bacterium]|nr:hypothetical protein [bacterium]
MNSRVAVWLHEHFTFFKPEPLVKDLTRFLQGKMQETVLSTLSNDGSVRIVVESNSGTMSYSKMRGKFGKCSIEEIEFIPNEMSGFAFTVVDNELSILRHNGDDPKHHPHITVAEQQEFSEFMAELRQKTEEFLKTKQA